MSEIMRIVDEVEALAALDARADELKSVSDSTKDARGLETLRIRAGALLDIFATRVGKEAAHRRFALQSYMLTIEPESLEEATALLKLAFYLTRDNLVAEYEEAIVDRAFRNVIAALDSTLPTEKRGRLAYAESPCGQSWERDVTDLKAAAEKYLTPLATTPVATTISN